jgi:hypothetical protein
LPDPQQQQHLLLLLQMDLLLFNSLVSNQIKLDRHQILHNLHLNLPPLLLILLLLFNNQ